MIRELTPEDYEELVATIQSLSPPVPLDDNQIKAVAERAQIREVLRGEIVMRQGDEPDALYLVLSGQLRAADTSGDEPYLLYYHGAKSFVGELGLLYDRPRGATIDVLDDAKLAFWDREKFDWMLGLSGEMHAYFGRQQATYIRVREPFPGKQWDEFTAIRTGKHPLTLLYSLTWPLLLMLFSLGLLFLLLGFVGGLLVLIGLAAGLPAIISLLWGVYNYVEWKNDEYIVTSKRVIHIERFILHGIERDEAPLIRIQDVTLMTGSLLQRLLDYHDLIVKTAGAGNIVFRGLSRAEAVQDIIFEQRARALERRAAADKATIRQALAQKMRMPIPGVSIPEETLELPPDTLIEDKTRWFLSFLDYLLPRMRVIEGDTITWRKHWFIWLKRTWWPLLAALILLVLIALALLLLAGGQGQNLRGLTAVPALLGLSMLVVFVLYLYQHDGWRRDVYIVTSDRIIDVEGTPFRLGGEERREGTFDVVQNITYDIPDFFHNLLNMGSVTIETAGTAATFTFQNVLAPSDVQQEIFNRMVAYQESQRQRDQERQAARIGDWFDAYNQLQESEREGR